MYIKKIIRLLIEYEVLFLIILYSGFFRLVSRSNNLHFIIRSLQGYFFNIETVLFILINVKGLVVLRWIIFYNL